jgi:outer membrane protein assembly factor BamB
MTEWRRSVTSGLGAVLVALTTVGSAQAQLANTTWPIISHDNQHTGRTTVVGPQDADLKWVKVTGYLIKSSPVIGTGGKIYIGLAKLVCAINPVDGGNVWCRQLPGILRRSAPTLASNGLLYAGTRDNRLWALDAGDGTEFWSYTVGNDGDVNTSPAIASDGTVYMAGTFNGIVHALTPGGNLVWKLSSGGTISYSSPALGLDGTIYIGTTRGDLHSIAPNGTRNWTAHVGRRIRFASPSVGADGTIYIGSTDGLAAVDPSGSVDWVFPTIGFVSSTPALGADGTIYFGSTGKAGGNGAAIYALNPNGSLKWSFPTAKPVFGSPIVGGDGTIYGSAGPTVYALRPNGTVLWQFATGKNILMTPAISADGTLYIGSDNLYAFGD